MSETCEHGGDLYRKFDGGRSVLCDRCDLILGYMPPDQPAVPSDHTATTEDAAQRLWQAIDDGLIEGRLTRTDCSLIAGLLATARPGTATAEDESRPVAEVRAEECERLAAEHDRESAERAAASRVAAVRCLRCNLRYEERDQYSCGEPGSGHDYLASEIEDARYVVVEPTYEGDRLRERAAAIHQGAGQ